MGETDSSSGKRYFAHNGRDPGAFQEPVVYWFRKVKAADGTIEFVLLHRVSDDTRDRRFRRAGGRSQWRRASRHRQREQARVGDPFPTQIGFSVARRNVWKVIGGRPQDGYGNGPAPKLR